MSQASATTARGAARSSAATSPVSGCAGRSGSAHTGTSSGGSSEPGLATTTTSSPASRAAASDPRDERPAAEQRDRLGRPHAAGKAAGEHHRQRPAHASATSTSRGFAPPGRARVSFTRLPLVRPAIAAQ